MGYCHQGWLSSDQRFLYVNDEFDELDQNAPVRTLAFDVTVLETADLVGTYTNGRNTPDHHLYTKNDFVFHSNYESGLWIFEANDDRTNPRYRGFFDTAPESDNRSWSAGLWGNYPFLPSGVVAISDINKVLFIVDVSEATRVKRAPESFRLARGRLVRGGLQELAMPDGETLDASAGSRRNLVEPPLRLEFDASSRRQDVSKLRLDVRAKASVAGLEQTVEAYDWPSGGWVALDTRRVTSELQTATVPVPGPDRFVQMGTLKVRARVGCRLIDPGANAAWTDLVDQADATVNP